MASLVATTACSGDEPSGPTANTSDTVTTESAATTTILLDEIASTTGGTETVAPSTATAVTSAGGPAIETSNDTSTLETAVTAAPDPRPSAVEAGGWRLVVERPLGGEEIGRTLVVCYAVSGDSREAIVALELSLLTPGSESVVETHVADAAVGRGEVAVELPDTSPGRYDLRVTVVSDGSRREDLSVRVDGLQQRSEAPPATCV